MSVSDEFDVKRLRLSALFGQISQDSDEIVASFIALQSNLASLTQEAVQANYDNMKSVANRVEIISERVEASVARANLFASQCSEIATFNPLLDKLERQMCV